VPCAVCGSGVGDQAPPLDSTMWTT
jgi:hypothetical protein